MPLIAKPKGKQIILNTTDTLGDSDVDIPSQKAVKTYVDTFKTFINNLYSTLNTECIKIVLNLQAPV